MNNSLLTSKFEKIGARIAFRPLATNRWTRGSGPLVIDIDSDRHGEFFDVQVAHHVDVRVIDLRPSERHLLLMATEPNAVTGKFGKHKFLCGFDERHWFVAAIPEKNGVSTVITAKEALKPELVRRLESGKRGNRLKHQRRRTETFVRQGEWFFIPQASLKVAKNLILHREPIRRGGGKPHYCECLFRSGGRTVYVSSQFPNGLTESEFKTLTQKDPAALKWGWRTMQRDMVVYVRGRISHSDHATIRLDGWHRVEMNTENQSLAMAHVAFLD